MNRVANSHQEFPGVSHNPPPTPSAPRRLIQPNLYLSKPLIHVGGHPQVVTYQRPRNHFP